ncbi:hypothetical protein RN333_08515 [Enterobacter kobei]|uniref:hypothetical protein n=1 Tax=Enterobacter kobei TaxID=208224 RepID=UPI0028D45959|nr:hypothetical protein [Enterobacter kobei]WNP33606.1 hypothetical protein RN333_16130 [Enterobacter kobei]WNP36226.1 hypothetical protein RN333_08515 [Enterobacter kobei]
MNAQQLTINLKLIASSLELSRKDIAEIVTIGGVETSSSRADKWLRSSTATKNATGNSELAGSRVNRTDTITDAEFTAFCTGLKPWLDAVNKE